MSRLSSKRVTAGLLLVVSAAACGRAPTPGLARGASVYDTCAPCHGTDGAGSRALSAPPIAGLPQWYVQAQLEGFLAGHRGADPFDTVGIRMRSMARAIDLEGDLESVAEYVSRMAPASPAQTVTGDVAAGEASYQLCAACHGTDGRGNDVLRAPPLAGQADWYMLGQLRKFRTGWRGTAPADVWGATMRANAMTLDDAAMTNVVAYIRTLR